MPSREQRAQRVANGSRRKRDLAAVKPGRVYEPIGYAAKHFPDLPFGKVQAAAYYVSARHHHREYPAPAAVRERMVEKGWLVSDGEEK